MGDLQHFKDWSAVLGDFQRKQAGEAVARIEQIFSSAAITRSPERRQTGRSGQ
jgi:hypothetical protein